MNMNRPEASYDCLTIIAALEGAFSGVSRLEIQRLSFLACILFMYRGGASAEWGYSFASTAFSTPYCAELNDIVNDFQDAGFLSEREGRFYITAIGSQFLEVMKGLRNCIERDVYLHASCGSALAVPRSVMAIGLNNEPTILSGENRTTGAALLTGPALTLLHDYFQGLTQAIPGAGSDLLTPSIVWLTYIADSPISKKQEQATHGA